MPSIKRSDLSRGKPIAVIKDRSTGLFSALCVNSGRLRLDLGMLSVCGVCEELETGWGMKACIRGRHGCVCDSDWLG